MAESQTGSIKVRVEVDSDALRKDITNLLVGYTDWLIENYDLDPYDSKEMVTLTSLELAEDFFALEVD